MFLQANNYWMENITLKRNNICNINKNYNVPRNNSNNDA